MSLPDFCTQPVAPEEPLYYIWEASRVGENATHDDPRPSVDMSWYLRSYIEADQILSCLQEVQRHHDMLRGFGMAIIQYSYEPRPAEEAQRYLEDVNTFYAASRYVQGIRCARVEDQSISVLIPDITPSIWETSVVKPLIQYLEWCSLQSPGQLVLPDIFGMHQYSLHPESGTVFLHDIDPWLISIRELEESGGFSAFEYRH